MYYVITLTPDGEVFMREETKQALESQLTEEAARVQLEALAVDMPSLPARGGEVQDWVRHVAAIKAPPGDRSIRLIIKGEIVVPREVSVAVKRELP